MIRLLLLLLLVLSPNAAYALIDGAEAAPNIATDHAAWLRWLSDRIHVYELNCPVERTTTYYFDNVGGEGGTQGNDDTGDGSIGNPWRTRAKAISVDGPNVRCRFMRGDEWRETGNWAIGANQTVGDYGPDNPMFILTGGCSLVIDGLLHLQPGSIQLDSTKDWEPISISISNSTAECDDVRELISPKSIGKGILTGRDNLLYRGRGKRLPKIYEAKVGAA